MGSFVYLAMNEHVGAFGDITIRDHHHEVSLGMGIIFMYYMFYMYNMSMLEASCGRGWCLWKCFCHWRRRRMSWRCGTLTMKSGLTWGSFLCVICLFEVVPGARDAADGHVFVADVSVVGDGGPGPSPLSSAWHAH